MSKRSDFYVIIICCVHSWGLNGTHKILGQVEPCGSGKVSVTFISPQLLHSMHTKKSSGYNQLIGQLMLRQGKYTYSRRQYKVSVPYRLPTVPYRTFKKRLARPYHFILLGVTQYYCYTRSEYRAESSFKWIFLLCLYRCCSSRLFLTRPFRSSLSIVSALLVDQSLLFRPGSF